MKTLKQFANEILSLKDELIDKPVVIIAPNGLEFEPQIKFQTKEPLSLTKENVEKAVVNWE